MTLFRRVLGLDAPDSPDLPVDPNAPLPAATAGDTASVRAIAGRLATLGPVRARYVAAFAYLLGRAAHANGAMTASERAAMLRIAEVGGLDEPTRGLVVDLAGELAGEFGATEDFLVAREFRAISSLDERHQLLRCCFLVMAADDEIDATESWLANRLAEELGVDRPDLNSIRAEFHEQLSSVRSIRELRGA